MEYRTLGKTDIKVSQLGFGTLTMGFSQKNLSYQEGAALIEYAVRRGVSFLDTAEYYDTYPYIRPALDRLKADGVAVPVISSKSLAGDYDGMRKAVEESLSALDLPYIDIFLLHEVMGMDDFAARSGAWEALKDCKKEGLIKAMGGNELSAYGLCHLGDYQATLFSPYSHNRQFGEAFVKGEKFDKLAEGVDTTKALVKLGEQYHVDLPICCGVNRILSGEETAREVLSDLFLRSIKSEI